jgi:signal transduction histidine kinase
MRGARDNIVAARRSDHAYWDKEGMLPEATSKLLDGAPELARLILAEVPAGVGYYDGQGALTVWNAELERVLGRLPRRAGEVRFRPNGVTDMSATVAPVERALAGEATRAADLQLVKPGGAGRWLRVTALPLPGERPTEPGNPGNKKTREIETEPEVASEAVDDAPRDAINDVTTPDAVAVGAAPAPAARPAAGAVLLVVDVGEARSLDAVRDQILSVVAHDLRNPLSALRMTITMLNKPQDMATTRRNELAERMLGTIGRMEALVSSLVEHAQSERGMPLRLQREPTDLDDIYGRVKRDLDVLFPGMGVQVTRRGRLDGLWDSSRIQRVMANLLTNAIKHGAFDQPVTLTLDGSSNEVVWFSVHNRGNPMPPDLLSRAFEPFSVGPLPADGRRRQLGLGLFIVEQLVTAHGGKVSASSSSEEGTTFIVTLPRR